MGYINWAVQTLIARSKEIGPVPTGGSSVPDTIAHAESVGGLQYLRAMVEAERTGEQQQAEISDEDETHMDTS